MGIHSQSLNKLSTRLGQAEYVSLEDNAFLSNSCS